MSLNSSQLRAFHTVAVHRQFTTAARALNVTQPTLSNQVAALELQFDVRLFDRSARGVTLTPVGERLFELTQQHFAIAEQAEQLLSASGTLAGGFVRIGAVRWILSLQEFVTVSRAQMVKLSSPQASSNRNHR